MADPEFTSVATLKTRLQITGEDYDDLLKKFLLTGESSCKNIIMQEYIIKPAEDITEIQDGDGSQRLYLHHYPINSLTSIKVNDEAISEWQKYGDTGYRISEPRHGVIKLRGYYLSEGFGNVEIKYKPGYDDANSVPEDIKEAAYRVASTLWNHKDIVGTESTTIEGLTQKVKAMKDKTLLDLLNPFIRKRIA
jgi:hypothetical protein